MKKFLALLLALTLALSLAVPAYAADPTEEDALDWAALEAELAKAEAEQRAAALKELGAAAGQINVLLNDKCVASPRRGARAQGRPHHGAYALRGRGHGCSRRL